jgi:hypothetical protein
MKSGKKCPPGMKKGGSKKKPPMKPKRNSKFFGY